MIKYRDYENALFFSRPLEVMSKRLKSFPPETTVKTGDREAHDDVDILEKRGRNDTRQSGSGC